MNDRNNKTSICSIVFLDVIDYSKKTDSEQIEIKNQFNALINRSLKDMAENDRIILDTGDGAAIASNGSPEDVLFIALSIRDEILKSNIHSAMPLYVRFGINLGPVRVVQDINGRPNMIGDGINVAQRIMSFAKPNQILVSRSYYEVTSRLTQEISQMFDYSGIKQDKHVREHEVYSVRLLKEQADSAKESLDAPTELLPTQLMTAGKKINWKYAALAAPAVIAFFLIFKNASETSQPTISMDEAASSTQIITTANAQTPTSASASELASPAAVPVNTSKDLLLPNESVATLPSAASLPVKDLTKTDAKTDVVMMDKTPEELLKIEKVKKKAQLKAKQKAEQAAQQSSTDAKPQHGTVQNQEVVAAKTDIKKELKQEKPGQEKSGWNTFKDSVKQGGENKCTQAQIAMSQCN